MMGLPGGGEMIIIFVAVLLLFGAKKLPDLAKGMGKAMGEFKRARNEFEQEIRRAEYSVQEETRKLEMRSPATEFDREHSSEHSNGSGNA
ncbi:MAG: twin-arginine translocase TatA/TatE family subunit [Verrucomicrobiota bacterium]